MGDFHEKVELTEEEKLEAFKKEIWKDFTPIKSLFTPFE